MKHDIQIQLDKPVKDDRFRSLLGDHQWMQLPQAIRSRFGKRVQGGASVAYQGHVSNMQMNWAGRLLAHAARLIGAPLPYDMSCVGQPVVVVVTEDIAGNGQFWIRQYGRAAGFPQIVHSSKRFSGPSGLEEYIGCGVGMALKVQVEDGALMFKSQSYFVSILGFRIYLPRILSPGALVIGHHDLGGGKFRFSMRLKHRLFGAMLDQDAIFQDGKI